ncbi:MAG TPA: hypothetical protein VFB59_01115, partial [Candidatus Saccharimonadales bacterium]|nr:hypothetical protein [Candidatus Saccharimonadales bacterium]
MRVIEHILSTIAPHNCVGCDQEGSLLCSVCVACLPNVPARCYRCFKSTSSFITCQACRKQSPLFSVQPFTLYEGVAKELVHKLKFERAKAGAAAIADMLAKAIVLPPNVVLSHVPTATNRVRERGYDQA